jgi:hypothetical protein
MTDGTGSGDPPRAEPHQPSRQALVWCAAYYCVIGIAYLIADLLYWALTGHYESPSVWALHALKWLTLPGIALTGGSAMVAASSEPPRRWAFFLSLVMLIVYAWAWDLAQFLTSAPTLHGS